MSVTRQGPQSGDEMEPYGGDDEESAAVLRTIGRVVKSCRERKGLTQAELGTGIGYSEEQVSSVERGRRAPSATFLAKADEVVEAGGLISGLRKDAEEARYPKKVRDLAKLEPKAVEVCACANSVVHGLLRTPEYARALYAMRRPPFTEGEVERLVAARLARQEVFDRQPSPVFCSGRGDIAPPPRGQNGDAKAARTPVGVRPAAERGDPGDAHRSRAGRDTMTSPSAGDRSVLRWFKSSYSTNDGPECVEVAFAPRSIHLRDSKRLTGPQLAFAPDQWTVFVSYAADH